MWFGHPGLSPRPWGRTGLQVEPLPQTGRWGESWGPCRTDGFGSTLCCLEIQEPLLPSPSHAALARSAPAVPSLLPCWWLGPTTLAPPCVQAEEGNAFRGQSEVRASSHRQLPAHTRAQLIGRLEIIFRFPGARELEKCRLLTFLSFRTEGHTKGG